MAMEDVNSTDRGSIVDADGTVVALVVIACGHQRLADHLLLEPRFKLVLRLRRWRGRSLALDHLLLPLLNVQHRQ